MTQTNDKDSRLPIRCTDSQDVFLKVTSKWLNVCDELQALTNYVMNADFSSYSMDTESGTLKGYYIKIIKIKVKQMEFTVGVNDCDD